MIGLLWLRPRATVEVTVIRRLTDAEKAGTVVLWHPESPGVKVRVRPGLLRRLRLVRSEFATLGEMRRRMTSYAGGLPWLAGSQMEHVVDPALAEGGRS